MKDTPDNNRRGTDAIAERFSAIAMASQVSFTAPDDASSNWLPAGYELVTEPEYILRADDALLAALATDWRFVGDVNGGARVGRRAIDVGDGIRYFAKRLMD